MITCWVVTRWTLAGRLSHLFLFQLCFSCDRSKGLLWNLIKHQCKQIKHQLATPEKAPESSAHTHFSLCSIIMNEGLVAAGTPGLLMMKSCCPFTSLWLYSEPCQVSFTDMAPTTWLGSKLSMLQRQPSNSHTVLYISTSVGQFL